MNTPLPLLPTCLLWISALVPVGCTWALGAGEELPLMHQNFSRSTDIQTGIVQGDLEKAKAAAEWLFAAENRGSYSGDARVHEEAMLSHAGTIAEAADWVTITSGVGRLAASCGDCHSALGGGPHFVPGSQAPGGTSQEAHMIRHLWAADRMWEGLVGPSEESWKVGVEALALTDPSMAAAIRATIPDDALDGFLAAVSHVAVSAAAAHTQEDRAVAYGQVMESCQSCHLAIGAPTG